MDFFNEKKKNFIIIASLAIIIGVLVCLYFIIGEKNSKKISEDFIKGNNEIVVKQDYSNIVEEYYVDIKGAVKKPGVYKIKKGTIVDEVVKLAGGLKSTASTKFINLSYELRNHDVIYIYTNNEIKKNDIKEKCVCPDLEIKVCENSSIVSEENVNDDSDVIENNVNDVINSSDNDTIDSSKEENSGSKININSAGLEELMTLNGVGQSKAEAIIEYRKKNRFNTIDDLKNVSGIGEALFDKVKEYIRV